MGAVVYLIVQGVLDKVALLFRTAVQFDFAVIHGNPLGVQAGEYCEFSYLSAFRHAVRRSTSRNLLSGTDIADFPYAIMAIIVCCPMNESYTARGLSKERPSGECG